MNFCRSVTNVKTLIREPMVTHCPPWKDLVRLTIFLVIVTTVAQVWLRDSTKAGWELTLDSSIFSGCNGHVQFLGGCVSLRVTGA